MEPRRDQIFSIVLLVDTHRINEQMYGCIPSKQTQELIQHATNLSDNIARFFVYPATNKTQQTPDAM
jgi:hypothetical protein